MEKREIGYKYEKLAEIFLKNKGLKFLNKNFSCMFGEIDLIFLDIKTGTLIFIEVKYRRRKEYGNSLEVISNKKMEKIYLTSQYFLEKCNWTGNVRYDVIGIEGVNDITGFKIKWIKNAFEV